MTVLGCAIGVIDLSLGTTEKLLFSCCGDLFTAAFRTRGGPADNFSSLLLSSFLAASFARWCAVSQHVRSVEDWLSVLGHWTLDLGSRRKVTRSGPSILTSQVVKAVLDISYTRFIPPIRFRRRLVNCHHFSSHFSTRSPTTAL